jgi:serine/threonine protein kinase
MKMPQAGSEIDGFVIGARVRSGSMALIYQVAYAGGRASSFDMVMKVPRMTEGDGAETIVGFEVEHQIMQLLSGPHVPRLVAAGDMATLPYLVMEYVPGRTLNHWLEKSAQGMRPEAAELARLGAAVAHATHSLHQQDTVHLDIKPANVIIRDDGSAVLLDFGLSVHAHSPDLLAEELRQAVGSPAYMAPEQVVGVRGDPRSDIFAIGVMLFELATGELPLSAGFLAWRQWCDKNPEFDVGRLFARGNPQMTEPEWQAYNAPFPDRGHRAALRAFPPMVPEFADSPGAAVSRRAQDFWQHQWAGPTLMAIGQQDPVLGDAVMRALQKQIRGCSEVMLLPQAGHFVQEHGEPIAQRALQFFSPQSLSRKLESDPN